MDKLPWIYNDGGRSLAGFKGKANDCVCRALSIVTKQPYKEVYDKINHQALELHKKYGGDLSTARTGIQSNLTRKLMEDFGLKWNPTMLIGSGCTVHLRIGDLPYHGRLICSVTRHVTAVIDGWIHDNHDPSRNGTRCVYGYWEY
jgi:hypothetical protein